jgi:AbrB family looped-hinge helix DNA binding protein
MNAHVKLSVKGQVVIPKDVRDLLKWESGLDLEVIQRGDSVTLRPARPKFPRITWEEFDRLIKPHEGPAIPESEWQGMMDEELAKQWAEKGC